MPAGRGNPFCAGAALPPLLKFSALCYLSLDRTHGRLYYIYVRIKEIIQHLVLRRRTVISGPGSRKADFFTEEKERMTILLRYFKGLTQEQTARVVGVSQVQISRLERRGLKRLRESFEV